MERRHRGRGPGADDQRAAPLRVRAGHVPGLPGDECRHSVTGRLSALSRKVESRKHFPRGSREHLRSTIQIPRGGQTMSTLLKKLRPDLGDTWEEAKRLNDKTKDGRSFNAEEQKIWDMLNHRMDETRERIGQLEEADEREKELDEQREE